MMIGCFQAWELAGGVPKTKKKKKRKKKNNREEGTFHKIVKRAFLLAVNSITQTSPELI